MTERELQNLIRETCQWHGLLFFHPFDSRRSEPGWPDVVIVGPQGALFRELKGPRGRVTPAQQTWLDAMTTAGLNAGVWRPADWPDRVLAELERVR